MTVATVSADRIRTQIASILEAWGMRPEAVTATAQAMTETDLWGVDSHGISMLMMYEDMKKAGRLNLDARPRVVAQTPATARLDGDAGLGHPVARMGMALAVDKALAVGVGVVTACNSHHFGAAGLYAMQAAERGCIGLVTSTARTVAVVPTFGAQPVLGTNPIAFAAPGRRCRPFLLDMATSAVALNKVKVYGFAGKDLPAGWVVDGAGAAVTDPQAALTICREGDEGGLTPAGGTRELGSHKGYGLGVVAQLLGGSLAGGSFSARDAADRPASAPANIGHFFMALAPAFFRDSEDDYRDDVDSVIEVLHAVRPADPAQPVLVAGDPEAATRERRLREGVPLPAALREQVRAIAQRAGVPCVI
jgi:LDH2 family malate/lactate/ureidoglycolate dehydrogenase